MVVHGWAERFPIITVGTDRSNICNDVPHFNKFSKKMHAPGIEMASIFIKQEKLHKLFKHLKNGRLTRRN